MYTVKLLTEAELDITEACKWYESQQKGLAKKFLKELDEQATLIVKNPLHFPIKFSERFRFATLKKFPYFIVFKIYEEEKMIYIMSVFHTSRNPINL